MRRIAAWACLIIVAATTPAMAAGETDEQIVALYSQGKFRECLAAIEPHRAAAPLSTKLLSTSAHCKMSLGNAQGAREEYTRVLSQLPLTADLWVGRAQCEAAMGSLRDAEADFTIANQIDAKETAKFSESFNKLLTAAKPLAITEPIDSLWQKFLVAGREKPDQELVNLATQIVRSRNASRHIIDEDCTRAEAPLALAVRDKPADIEALLNEAAFLVHPTVTRPAVFNGTTYPATVVVHAPLPERAKPLLATALKIDAGNLRALALMAQALNDGGTQQEAIDAADRALAAGALNLDICQIRLDVYTESGNALLARAAQLRRPTYRTENHVENGQRVETTTEIPPSPEAIAEANRLEAQGNALRQQATAPMLKLIANTQASPAPADQLMCAMANARLCTARAQYDGALVWAQKALAIDPFQNDMLELLVSVGGSMQRNDIAIEADDRLNNAQNPSCGRTLDGLWPLMKQGQFDRGSAVIAEADKKDPGAIGLACARFAMAQEQGRLNDAVYAARLVNSLDLAKVTLDGRTISPKPPARVEGGDVVLIAFTFNVLGQMLSDAGQSEQAVTHLNRAALIAASVPPKELSTPVPETALAGDPTKVHGATYLGAIVFDSHRRCGELLMKQDRLKEAAPHLLAAAQGGDQTPQLPFNAYRCYKMAGIDAFGGQIPEAWREKFRIWDQQHADVSPQASAAADRDALDLQINQIDRQINQGVGPDDLRALTAKREALAARRAKMR